MKSRNKNKKNKILTIIIIMNDWTFIISNVTTNKQTSKKKTNE